MDLLPDGGFDYDGIRAAINEKTRLITIQRSKGYATRPSYSVEEIGKLIAFCKECKPDVLCMVDNCYGEFVETQEPTNVGADMVVGSLIKNLGGGLAPTGGKHRAPHCGGHHRGRQEQPLVKAGQKAQVSAHLTAQARSTEPVGAALDACRRAADIPADGSETSARIFDQAADDLSLIHI